MSTRYEERLIRMEKTAEIEVMTCEMCQREVITTRQHYFGDGRLIFEGDEDRMWFKVMHRNPQKDYVGGENVYDLCSAMCLRAWLNTRDVW